MDRSRSSSEAPSSESDFYANEVPGSDSHVTVPAVDVSPGQTAQEVQPDHQEPPAVAEEENHGQDSDASSEMDTSSDGTAAPVQESREPSAQPESEPKPLPAAATSGLKRSHDDGPEITNIAAQSLETTKRRKLSAKTLSALHAAPSPTVHDRLPIELWQQVFMLCHPFELAKCLRVDRVFHRILTATNATPVPGGNKKNAPRIRVFDSDAVWAQARRKYYPSLPKPLLGYTELQMFKLIASHVCHSCGKEATEPSPATSHFDCGPGPNGVRPIWAFGRALCGQCLRKLSLTDIELLRSPAVRFKLGLAFIYLTSDHHYVSEHVKQTVGIPKSIPASKMYFKEHVDEKLTEYAEAEAYEAAEEWMKGLTAKGKYAQTEAGRWEMWEKQLRDKGFANAAMGTQPTPGEIFLWPGSDLRNVLREYIPPINAHQTVMMMQTRNGGLAAPNHGPKPVRDQDQIQADVAQRRAEIERRCMELDPPIHVDALQYMASYRNAMMITQPLTDAGWEVLRPLLIAQREAAEEIAHQRRADLAALQSTIPYDYQEDMRPAREVYTEDYDRAQEPLRKKLSDYANEFVANHWSSESLNKDNSPKFATDLLQYVYWRYEDAKSKGELSMILDPPEKGSGKSTQWKPFLSLDNMKWVHDNKVRPYTDTHRRELFVCADCVEDPKTKPFAFEGLIQHYGAKHTTDFSRANIVVHWQTAAWPEEPPFATDFSFSAPSHHERGRKSANRKSNGHGHSSTQHGRGEAQRTPSAAKLLSENPYFSQSAHSPPQPQAAYDQLPGGPRYGGHGYDDNQQRASVYSQSYHGAVPAVPQVDMSDNAQNEKLGSDAREIWDALDGVKDMIVAIKVHTVVHHAARQFRAHFGFAPTLDTLTSALAYNSKIRPVKNATGLYCKSCVASQPGGSVSQKSYHERTLNIKAWNISSLSTHWNIIHNEDSKHLDWTKDMLELPDNKLVKGLIRAPGMDDAKLALVADAFPFAFPFPLPTIGFVEEGASNPSAPGLANRLLGRMNKQPPQVKKRKKGHAENRSTTYRDGSDSDPSSESKDDKYDPRRPALVNNEEALDPSRFDTDIAKASKTAPQTFGLAPETLAALNNLQHHAAESLRERSPSVGAPEQPQATAVKGEAPDISSILKAISGQQEQTAPPPPPAGRPESGPSQQYMAPYAQRQPTQSTPTHYYERVQDQNVHAYASNHHYPPQQQVVEYDYDYPPHHPYSRPSPSSSMQPPLAASPPVPLHHSRPPPPVQYDYRQVHPEPQTIFVDEHGRQVYMVPVDAGPAPIQYAPHPYDLYEQQHAPPPQQQHRRGRYD